MARLKTTLFCAVLFLITAFVGIGYAATTGSLSASGELEFIHPPIYIVSAEWVDGNISNLETPYFTADTMKSKVTLASNKNSYVVAKIVVKNCTDDVYGYNKSSALPGEGTYDNLNVTYSLFTDASCKNKMLRRTELHPQDTALGANGLTFYLKFSYVSGYNPTNAGATLNSFLRFEFLTPVDSIDEETVTQDTINGVSDKMLHILNDEETFNTLVEGIQNPPTSGILNIPVRGSDYIGTVTGSNNEDTQMLETLFDGNLHMIIDGQQVDVTIMIKYKNVTGDSNREMVLYSTTNTLKSSGRVLVYAQVFQQDTVGQSTTWHSIGGPFKGYADVNAYTIPNIGTGSFNTETWSTSSTSRYSGDKVDDLVNK